MACSIFKKVAAFIINKNFIITTDVCESLYFITWHIYLAHIALCMYSRASSMEFPYYICTLSAFYFGKYNGERAKRIISSNFHFLIRTTKRPKTSDRNPNKSSFMFLHFDLPIPSLFRQPKTIQLPWRLAAS